MDWEAELLENLVTQPVPGKPKRLKFNAMAERRCVGSKPVLLTQIN